MDNCTAIVSDGKIMEWARVERTRESIAMTASGKFKTIPNISDFPEEEDFAKAVSEYSKDVSSRVSESVTLGIPSSDIIFRIANLPTADEDEIKAMINNLMEKDAPLPIEEMTVSYEVLRREEERSLVLSAATPSARIDSMSALIGIQPSRIDRVGATVLGTLYALADKSAFSMNMRDIVLVEEGSDLTLALADSGLPVMIRSCGAAKAASQQSVLNAVRIALIQVQMEHGTAGLSKVICATTSNDIKNIGLSLADSLNAEFTLHTTASLPSPPHGLALRTIKSAAALNLFPESWKIEISERKFRKYLKIGLAAAAAAWLLLTSWLYAWPAILDQNIKRLNAQVEKRAAQEEEVNDLRNRIKIIDTYSDRTYSPIEALLAVATSQPEGVDMTSFRYTGDKNHVLVEGKSAITTLVYNFMEELNQSGFFTDVRLVSGPTLNRALNVFVFELSLNFKPAESEEGARR